MKLAVSNTGKQFRVPEFEMIAYCFPPCEQLRVGHQNWGYGNTLMNVGAVLLHKRMSRNLFSAPRKCIIVETAGFHILVMKEGFDASNLYTCST